MGYEIKVIFDKAIGKFTVHLGKMTSVQMDTPEDVGNFLADFHKCVMSDGKAEECFVNPMAFPAPNQSPALK